MDKPYVVGRASDKSVYSIYRRQRVGRVEVYEEKFVVGEAEETQKVADAMNEYEHAQGASPIPSIEHEVTEDDPIYGIRDDSNGTVAPLSGGRIYDLDPGFTWVRWSGTEWEAL